MRRTSATSTTIAAATPREKKKKKEAGEETSFTFSALGELLSAIARESKHLAGEIVEKKRIECRVLVFDLVPRAMHSIWSALHFIVGGLIAVILSIELALAFDASVVFFTGPLCLIGCRRLMTPTEIDDERLRRRAAREERRGRIIR